MAEQLTFVIVTPYSVRKSRTGAILSRLLGRTSAKLVAARILTPTKEFAEKYADSIRPADNDQDEKTRVLIRKYIRHNFSPSSNGRRHRTLMLVFKGENAYKEINEIVGRIHVSGETGETIRDTYGDLVENEDGSIRYFEPAVLTPDYKNTVLEDIRLWMDFATHQPPLAENVCEYTCPPEKVQKTLVLIKPDSWRQGSSSRPGAIMDIFSRTGLRMIGFQLIHMSCNQAMEFYGPVKDVLCEKLAPGIGTKARKILEKELKLTLSEDIDEKLGEAVGIPYAKKQFSSIIKFMSGTTPEECPDENRDEPGTAPCLALIYEGEDAINRIRTTLGPTDPTKAPDGTVRKEYGSDVMINTAHGSDSPENVERELGILRFNDDRLVPYIEQILEDI